MKCAKNRLHLFAEYSIIMLSFEKRKVLPFKERIEANLWKCRWIGAMWVRLLYRVLS